MTTELDELREARALLEQTGRELEELANSIRSVLATLARIEALKAIPAGDDETRDTDA